MILVFEMDNKENTNTEPLGETKPRRNWNGWDIFFIVTPILCIILIPLGGFFDYLRGRFENVDFCLISCMFYLAIGLFFFFCIVYGLVRLFVNWKSHTWEKRFIIVFEIGIPIVVIVIFFTSFLIPSYLRMPGYKPFMYGFRDRMRSQADIEDIRNWLKTLRKEDYAGDINRLPYNNFPESLKVFGRGINLSADKNGNPKVSLAWGSGFGQWGIVIGMEDMEIPPSYSSQYGEFRLAVESGVYVWHEIQ